MSFSQSASVNFVPLIARLILAAAFIPVGWNKLMKDAEFSGQDAKRLRELQVVSDDTRATRHPLVVPAALRQLTPATPPAQGTPPASETNAPRDRATTPVPPVSGPTSEETTRVPGTDPEVSGAGEPVKARGLHRIALMIDSLGWSYQVPLAWLAAITELVGGLLVFVGLFTRLWALGLASTMAMAFYLTSLDGVLNTFVFGMSVPDYTRFAAQIGLFGLAFGLVFSGAGALSLDRMMLRRRSPEPTPKREPA